MQQDNVIIYGRLKKKYIIVKLLFIYLLFLHYLFTHITRVYLLPWVHNLTLFRYVYNEDEWYLWRDRTARPLRWRQC
jgi:presenilin-like A22 family membrane protease